MATNQWLKPQRMLVLLLCALLFAACTSEQEARERQDRIREAWVEGEISYASEQFDTEADCPDHSDAGDGDAIRCRVESLDGTSLLVDAVQTDDEGRLRLTTRLLETRKTEMVLQDRLTGTVGGFIPIDCTDLVEVKKGGTFECSGSGLGVRVAIRAKFTDDGGGFTYTTKVR